MAYTPFKFPQQPTIQQTLSQTPGYFGQLNMPVPPAGPATQNQGMLPSATPNAMPRNQKAAIIMGALSDIFRGQDPTQNTVVRQQQMVAMDAQRKAQERFQKAYDNASPDMKKIMAGYSDNIPAWDAIQTKLDINKLTNTGGYAGTTMDAQFLNDLEKGAVDPEFQKTSRYKVAYQEMHKPTTYINAAGQPETKPGLRPGTYPNPFGDVENEDGSTVGISQNERSTLIKSNIAVDDATDRIKVLAKSIQEIDPNPLTFGTERAEIDSKYTQLQLELKNLFALGVLAGADLDLLEAVTGNPTDWKQFLIRGGKDGSLIQLQSLLEIANINKNRNLIKLGQETQPTPDLFGVNEQATQERVRITLD